MPRMDPHRPHDDPTARGMASEVAQELASAKAETTVRLAKLEALVGYLTAKLLSGQPLAASDQPVLDFFGISSKNPDPGKLIKERFAHRYAKKRNMVECPACGSNVLDVEGVLDETCTFCGATVRTES